MEKQHRSKLLAQSKNGTLAISGDCRTYHLGFGQFYLELTLAELQRFGVFLEELDVRPWEADLGGQGPKRRISIPTQQENLWLTLDRAELEEPKALIFYRKCRQPLSLIKARDLDYEFNRN